MPFRAVPSIDVSIDAVKARHRQGDVAFAERAYRALLDRDPGNHEAWYLLGIVAHQTGDPAEAVRRMEHAIGLRGDVAAYHSNLGIVLEALGRTEGAETAYRTAARLDPEHAHAILALGNLLATRGDMNRAAAALRAAVAASPASVDAIVNLGGVLMALKDKAGAATVLAHAVRLEPSQALAARQLTRVLLDLGRIGEAAAELTRQVRLSPSDPAVWYALGAAAGSAGERRKAAIAYGRAVTLDPSNAAARQNHGATLMHLGLFEAAAEQFRAGLRLNPGEPALQANLAAALVKLGRSAEAEAVFRSLVRAQPDNVRALNALALVLHELGRWEEHAAILRRAVALAPDAAEPCANLALAEGEIGCVENAVVLGRRAVRLDPREDAAHSTVLFNLNYLDHETGPSIAAAHVEWGSCVPAAPRRPAAAIAGRRLRIGYVSPDLRSHSVAWFLTPLLRAHDRRAVELFCYAEVERPDATTARLRALSDHWRSTVGLSDAEVAGMIAADGIDVIVDLAGHSPGNRLRALALRPAPVQATWLGYPNTTGLRAIDYRLTDHVADPPGAEALHAEALVRLPGGFLCYEGPAEVPETPVPPSRTAGHVMFGSFNNLPKLTPAVVAAWSRILHRVPGARLMIKSRCLDHAPARRRLLDLFGRNGIAADRIDMVSWVDSTAAHLKLYSRIDVALDSFPYNGTTTTCEALWMGVPVVTQAGDRHAARVGASLLRRLDLDDLVARDTDGYVETAVALAGDPDRTAFLRADLRARLRSSSLGDAPAFARGMEDAMRRMLAQAGSIVP